MLCTCSLMKCPDVGAGLDVEGQTRRRWTRLDFRGDLGVGELVRHPVGFSELALVNRAAFCITGASALHHSFIAFVSFGSFSTDLAEAE